MNNIVVNADEDIDWGTVDVTGRGGCPVPLEDLTREGVELGWSDPRFNSSFEGLESVSNNAPSALHTVQVTFV